MDKHFTLYNINFTQRVSDGRVDGTQICQTRNKMFANWSRMKKAQQLLSQFDNPIEKKNRHSWIIIDCVKSIVEWVFGEEISDFTLLDQELQKEFSPKTDEPTITHKTCTGCKEELPVDNFGMRKNTLDGFERYCKTCLREERAKNSSYHTARSLEYYNENKDECNRKRTERKNASEENKEKAREANRKSSAKSRELLQKDREYLRTKEEKLKNDNIDAIKNMGQLILENKDKKPYQIVCRESDGYVDVTNLCKAGCKEFKAWNRLVKTREYLKILAADLESEHQKLNSNNQTAVTITAADLIKLGTGTKFGSTQTNETWVHPKIAINIAQWISPKFDLQVSKWIHQLLVLGSVRLTDKISNAEIQSIQIMKAKRNRLMKESDTVGADQVAGSIEERMKELEERCLEFAIENEQLSKQMLRRKRVHYDQTKVIYIVKHDEFENCFKVGISNNLTNRMSTFNTYAPENYEVVYYTRTMYNGTIELMIKKKFIQYLYSQNKEWFHFPDGPSDLIDSIKKGIDFFES